MKQNTTNETYKTVIELFDIKLRKSSGAEHLNVK